MAVPDLVSPAGALIAVTSTTARSAVALLHADSRGSGLQQLATVDVMDACPSAGARCDRR